MASVSPNLSSYILAAKPYIVRGDYEGVEELMSGLRADGIPYDDVCLSTLLYTYRNAKPKQREKAEQVFCEFVARGTRVTHESLRALARVMGRTDAEAVCVRCGVEWHQPPHEQQQQQH